MSWEPYSAYKPSDVPWLSDVPEHWEVRRLKEAATTIAGQAPPSGIVSEYLDYSPFLQGNAEFGRMHPSARLACETPPKWAKAGDILLSVRAPVGALNVADQDYGIGRGLCAVRTQPSLRGLFTYYILGVANQELLRLSTGSTYDAVTVGIVRELAIPLPPLPSRPLSSATWTTPTGASAATSALSESSSRCWRRRSKPSSTEPSPAASTPTSA